jgi:hypothetical protein
MLLVTDHNDGGCLREPGGFENGDGRIGSFCWREWLDAAFVMEQGMSR